MKLKSNINDKSTIWTAKYMLTAFLWRIICDNKIIFAHARVGFESDTAKLKSAWMGVGTNFPTNSCDTSNGARALMSRQSYSDKGVRIVIMTFPRASQFLITRAYHSWVDFQIKKYERKKRKQKTENYTIQERIAPVFDDWFFSPIWYYSKYAGKSI